MRKLLLILIWVGSLPCFGQVLIPIQSIGSGGAATTLSGGSTVTGFGNMGQPMVFPRISKTSNGGGAGVMNNIMFATSTIDTEPPVIVSVAGLSITKGADATFNSTITDNFQSSLNAVLYYRSIAGGGAFDSVALDKNATAFSITVPTGFYNNGYDDVGMEYYVKAHDASVYKRSPVSGSLYTYLTNPNAQVSASLLTYGNKLKNYRIISIPYDISGAVSEVFTDLPTADKKSYRLWQYDTETTSWTEYPDFNTIDRARGYFIIMSSDISTVNLKMGSQKTETNNQSSLALLYDLTLKPGWNLIGNPYPVAINWSDVLALNGNPSSVGSQLKIWGGSSDAGQYSNLSGNLAAFQGAFVLLSGSSNVTLDVPFPGRVVGSRIAEESFTTNLAEPKWRLPLTLLQAGNDYQMSALGMHPDAKISVDPYDDFNPPAFFESMEIDFAHPEHAWGDFARDMVPTSAEYVWRFKVKTGLPDDATIQWDNTGLGDNNIELFLYDVRTNTIINMREENHYSFSPAESKEFKLYYGKDLRERIGPDEITVDEPYPNPFSIKNPVKFVVGLPDNLVTSYPVEMIIRNSVGLPVYVQKQTLTPGLHTLTWTGRKSDNEMPPAGFYFYTVKVGARSFTGKVVFTNQND